MKKSFKKLGFVSLVASGVLLGGMNATDLETYAALQKPSHVFGNYAEKDKEKEEGSKKEVPTGFTNGSGKSNSGSTPTPQQQAQNTASSDSKEATTLENTASTDNTTATTDETYTKNADTTVAGAAQKVETDNTAVQSAEQTLKTDVAKVQADASTKDFDETTFQADQAAEQTAETNLQKAENQLTKDQNTLETALKDQTPSTPTTPPTKEEPKHTASSGTPPAPESPPAKKDETSGTPSASGSSVASQLVKDATTVNSLKSVSVSGMNTTLSGVETMSKQTATISALLNSSTDLSSVISNAQGKQRVWHIRKRSKHFKRLFGFF
ncbi:hypothetical protein ID0189_01200 [Helicobacter pylori]